VTKNSKQVSYVVTAGVIAALYFALTLISSAMGLAFGPIQLRLSEILCILPIFTPAAIPGLVIGCILSNLSSPYGLLDVIVGSSATLLAALLTRQFRNIKTKGFPFLSAIMPVFFNAIFIGAEIAYITADEDTFWKIFFVSFAQIGIGEFISIVLIGLLFFYKSLKKISFEKLPEN